MNYFDDHLTLLAIFQTKMWNIYVIKLLKLKIRDSKLRIFGLFEGQRKQFGVDTLQSFEDFMYFDILLPKRLIN